MSGQIERLAIALPKRMRSLERDPRGYPIPYIVLRDKSGRAQFTINDVRRTEPARTKKLCAICGRRLDTEVWFIGGSRCFMHPNGAFIDGPVHYECGHYALRVCPFLALPNYAKRIDDKLLGAGDKPDGLALARVDFMPPDQPERFGFGATADYKAIQPEPQHWLYVARSWNYIEWWRNGIEVNAPDGLPSDQPLVRAKP